MSENNDFRRSALVECGILKCRRSTKFAEYTAASITSKVLFTTVVLNGEAVLSTVLP